MIFEPLERLAVFQTFATTKYAAAKLAPDEFIWGKCASARQGQRCHLICVYASRRRADVEQMWHYWVARPEMGVLTGNSEKRGGRTRGETALGKDNNLAELCSGLERSVWGSPRCCGLDDDRFHKGGVTMQAAGRATRSVSCEAIGSCLSQK
jgi:hypothetical protein